MENSPLRLAASYALELRQSGAGTGTPLPPGYLEESRAPQIITGNVICQVFGTTFVLARAYSRLFILHIWKLEDWALMVAWLFATGYSIGVYGQVAHGAGRHVAALTNFQDAVTSQKYAFANIQILFFALTLPKFSICLMYIRIFYFDKRGRHFIQGLMVVLALATFPFCVKEALACKPVHAYWTELRPPTKCSQDLVGFYLNAALNASVDLSLMAILVPRILHLNMNKGQKGILLGIVSLGFLVVAAAIMRMVRVGTILGSDKTEKLDPPWETYDVSIWTSTEIYASVICAAAPGVKPMASKLLSHLPGTTLWSRSRTTGGRGHRTGPIELSDKLERTTLSTGGGTLHKSVSTTGLTTRTGPWLEVGRGTDEESIGGRSDEERYHERPRTDGGILKKSEITVCTAQGEPHDFQPLEATRA